MGRPVKTVAEWVAKYRKNVANAGQDWVDGIQATPDIAEAAKSDAAETAYAQGVQTAVAQKLRLKGLRDVTTADIKAAVTAVGPGGYTQPATAKAAKGGKKVGPYLEEISRVRTGLPSRSADATTNITQRSIPLAVALQNKKRTG